MLLVRVGVVPVEFVVDNVLARVGRPGPLQSDSCFANIGRPEAARLGGHSCKEGRGGKKSVSTLTIAYGSGGVEGVKLRKIN